MPEARTIYSMKSFNQILTKLLEDGPVEIMTLIETALSHKPLKRSPEFLAGDLFRLALRRENGFVIAQMPSYSLSTAASATFNPKGMYAKWTLKTLRKEEGKVELSQLVKTFPDLYRLEAQHLWVYLHITRELAGHVIQTGTLKIGLQEVTPSLARKRAKPSLPPNGIAQINNNIHETHLEGLLVENLAIVEEGLELLERQFNTPPVGRIDLLCRDKRGNLVIIEIKKFGSRNESIIDQITRYMGWVQHNMASKGQIVRGIIVIGAVDERLTFSVKAIPNLHVKSFSLSLNNIE